MDDRILLIGALDHVVLRAISERVTIGLIVGIGAEEEVLAARRMLADCDNVMLIRTDDGPIPWQAGFFTRIYVSAEKLHDADLLRLLAPGGLAIEL